MQSLGRGVISMVTFDGIVIIVGLFLLSLWMIHLILKIISLATSREVGESVEIYQVFIEVRKYRDKPGKRPKQVRRSGLREVRFTRVALEEGVVDHQLDVKGIITEMEEGSDG